MWICKESYKKLEKSYVILLYLYSQQCAENNEMKKNVSAIGGNFPLNQRMKVAMEVEMQT